MIIFFHGKNSFLSLQKAKEGYSKLKSDFPSYNYVEIDADNSDAEFIIQTIQTQEMFSDGKVVFFKRLYARSDKDVVLESLMELLEEEADDHNIVIWEDRKIPANTRYLKFIKKNFDIYESPDLNKRTFMTWAKNECQNRDISISTSAISQLANRSNYDPERFFNDLKKIEIFGSKSVDEELIKKLTTDTYEYEIWDLIDSINKGNKQKTMSILNSLFNQKVDVHYILSMIFRNSRILVLTKDLLEKGYEKNEIAKKLKLPPFTLPLLISSARSSDKTTFKKLYSRLTNLDLQIKTGQIDPQLGLTLLATVV